MKGPWPLIKVCGIRFIEEAEIALNNGANTIGLLVGLTHRARDKIDEDTAKTIAAKVRETRPGTRIVMVTHLLDPAEVLRMARHVGVTAIQIHDDMSPDNVAKLRAAAPGLELIKAIHLPAEGQNVQEDIVSKAKTYAPYVDALLTDSKTVDPDGATRIGGTGKRHDVNAGKILIDAFPHLPVIIAGGLNDTNVAEAIRAMRPAGIDANSGLENPDGTKNADKIVIFARAGMEIPPFKNS